jgi:hypothetical protein
MAKLDLSKIKAIRASTTYATGTVGNNRTLTRAADGTLIGSLHGHQIVAVSPKDVITLDHHHYRTVTTRNAMKDFVEAMTGWTTSISFANGNFTARIAGTDYTAEGNGQITIFPYA